MLLEYTNRRSHREHSLRALLELILIQCDRHCARLEATSEQKAAGRITQEFCTLVERHFSKKHRVQDYARSLNISLHTLTRAVRTQNGRSPVDIINERLLLEARRLLLHSTQTVGEIAYQLGFKSPSNFGRFFKMHAHCSPGDLRQRQLTAIPPQT